MTSKWSPPLPPQLRDDAEAELAREPPLEVSSRSAGETLHELQVLQIELEMQNDALRHAQIALEESRDLYVDLYEFAPVGYLTLSRNGQIEAINLTGAALLGDDRSRLTQNRFARFVVSEDKDQWHRHFLHALRQEGKQSCEVGLKRRDGSIFGVLLTLLSGDAASPLRLTLTDITERRQAVSLLRDANRRLEMLATEQAVHLRQLAGALTHAEQRERDRLYELLHGDLQPLLVAARLSLSSMSTRTPAQECLSIAAEAAGHIGKGLQIARTLSQHLNPPLIRERGLAAALESLIGWVKCNHSLEVVLTCTPDDEPDDLAIRLLCFNAVRELLMNTVKHAGTTRVNVALQLADFDTLRIVVSDQGSGFDPTVTTNGSGLAAIAYRMAMVGGSLQVESQPGHGTTATLLAPLRLAITPKWANDSRERRSAGRERHDDQDTDRG
jgi:PAS domain S-box-containing protein